MISITQILTLTTMSTDINNGLEWILSPLKLFKIPVGVFAMLISLTLRFIPTLLSESKKIMAAQASRGVDFNEGSLKDKVNQIISLLIPMFVISFKRAEDLSNAMEARGYIIGAKRTKLDELKLRWRDYLCLLIVIALFGLVIWSMIYYA
jgi:energy-coupling factor transport system permease protein